MFQRKPNYKPVTLNDNHKIDLLKLIRFLKQAHFDLEKKKEEDSAFRFEMLIEYLEKDFSNKKGLTYEGRCIGL